MGISNCLQQHEYLRDTPIPIYKECVSCNSRTLFTCVRCGHCYSCHWKTEKVERQIGTSAVLKKYSPSAARVVKQPSAGQQIMVMDVYGRQMEPICNYRACSHNFSTHGHSRKCRCRHALNYAAGISLKGEYSIYS